MTSLVAVGALTFAGCGGGDDDEADDTDDTSASTTTLAIAATTTTVAPVITAAPTTTAAPAVEYEYLTEGAVVVVANASRINGAAGRLTERLAEVGYTMAEATNSSDAVSNLEATQIYYVGDDPGAQAVAENLKGAFGGGSIEVLQVGVPALTESGELGDATVLVLMGNDIADKTLEEMQNPTAADDTATEESGDDTGDDEASDDTGDDTGDDTADDTGEDTGDDAADDTGDDTADDTGDG